MKIIGINTATNAGSVALLIDGRLIDEIVSEEPRSFSRSLLGLLESLLERNRLTIKDIDKLAAVSGPGSFTGIRIGMSTAIGIAKAVGCGADGPGTLEAMAWAANARLTATLVPTLDAGRGNLYTAAFRRTEEGMLRLTDDLLIPSEEVAEKFEGGLFISDRKEAGSMKHSIAAGAAMASYHNGKVGDASLLRPHYVHAGPVN